MNTIDWGQAAVNNTNGFGKAPTNNTIDFGEVCANSLSPETNLTGTGATPSFSNTKSILLDGVDDYVSLSSKTQNFTDFTVSVWFKTTSKGGANAIIGNSAAEGGYLFFIGQSGGVIKFYDSAYRTISGNIVDNAWHHLAVTYDSNANELKSYIDNSLFTTYTPSTSGLATNSHSFNQIGRRITIGQFIGGLDELAVFSSVLSSTEVSNIYGSGVPTSLASLNPVHWWRCGDGDTAPTLTDNGSGGIDGTITNFTTFSTDVPT